jgi:hypothetical protein
MPPSETKRTPKTDLGLEYLICKPKTPVQVRLTEWGNNFTPEVKKGNGTKRRKSLQYIYLVYGNGEGDRIDQCDFTLMGLQFGFWVICEFCTCGFGFGCIFIPMI